MKYMINISICKYMCIFMLEALEQYIPLKRKLSICQERICARYVIVI